MVELSLEIAKKLLTHSFLLSIKPILTMTGQVDRIRELAGLS